MKTAFAGTLVLLGLFALAPTSARAQTTGACCKPDATCREQTQDRCVNVFGGTWFEGVGCRLVNCVPTTTVTTVTTVTSTTSTTVPARAQGCTPGYWKGSHHFDSWVVYAPGDSFEAVFGRDVPGDPTLHAALSQGGGGLIALMRHAVAALLNASSPNVDPVDTFDTEAEVIAAFQSAFDSADYETTKDLFATSNQAGCPLN